MGLAAVAGNSDSSIVGFRDSGIVGVIGIGDCIGDCIVSCIGDCIGDCIVGVIIGDLARFRSRHERYRDCILQNCS